jgi:transcription initiation factor TFIID subunit 6
MQANAKTTLSALVEEHVSLLIREAISVQRHAKRARFHQTSENDGVLRKRLHADDINLALQWRGSEKLYATGTVVPTMEDSTRTVDLNAYVKSEMQLKAPSEVGLTMHWLAVDGSQPAIPQNPTQDTSMVHRISDDADDEDDPAGVSVRQLLPRLLSEELQLYFTRITMAVEKGGETPEDRRGQDAALAKVAQDAGLQELVPFFVRYLSKHLYESLGNPAHCRTLIRLTRSLLLNSHLHLELHLHQMLPALMTCVVAKKLARTRSDNHWALRQEAATTLLQACNL